MLDLSNAPLTLARLIWEAFIISCNNDNKNTNKNTNIKIKMKIRNKTKVQFCESSIKNLNTKCFFSI